MVKFWTNEAAIAAGTAYAVPTLAANEYLVGVRTLSVLPLAAAGTASTESPFTEAGTANNTAAPAAGQVSVQVAAQKLASGDAIPADAVIIVDVIIAGEQTLNP